MDGDGIAGGSIGITGTHCMAAAGTTPGAGLSTIAIIFTEEGACAAGMVPGHLRGITLGAEDFPTVPVNRPGPSTETPKRLVDMRNLTVRAESARVHSAGTRREGRRGAIHHAGAQATVAEDSREVVAEGSTVAAVAEHAGVVAGIGDQIFEGGRVLPFNQAPRQ